MNLNRTVYQGNNGLREWAISDSQQNMTAIIVLLNLSTDCDT